MIQFTTDRGHRALLKDDSIISVFDVPDKGLRVVNFTQAGEHMELWTEEPLDDIYCRLSFLENLVIKRNSGAI